MNKAVKSIREYYNSDINIERYGYAIDKVGLWKAEEIFFSKYITKKSKILDLGCGAGRTTINLYKKGYKNIIGVDIAEKLIDFAKNYCVKNNLSIPFQIGDATNLDFDNETFDIVIFSYNGMQCIPGKKNRDKCLEEVYRVLKPNGIFIFTAHNRDESGKYQQVWIDEKEKWDKGTQDKNLEMFGDRYTVDKTGETSFCHFSNIEEMEEFVKQQNFQILEHTKSTKIAEENDVVKEFAGETVFWACKKNKD